ncbi:UNVERIFIED_CONTAM: hypothetical protein FKN15_022486 [Acipenser sinensis]
MRVSLQVLCRGINKKPVEDESAMTFEESGDDSGEFQEDMAIELGSGSQWNEDLLRASSTAESEEGSADYTEDFPATPEGGNVDYSQFVFPDRVPIQQSFEFILLRNNKKDIKPDMQSIYSLRKVYIMLGNNRAFPHGFLQKEEYRITKGTAPPAWELVQSQF